MIISFTHTFPSLPSSFPLICLLFSYSLAFVLRLQFKEEFWKLQDINEGLELLLRRIVSKDNIFFASIKETGGVSAPLYYLCYVNIVCSLWRRQKKSSGLLRFYSAGLQTGQMRACFADRYPNNISGSFLQLWFCFSSSHLAIGQSLWSLVCSHGSVPTFYPKLISP